MEILCCEGVNKVYGSGEARVAALTDVNLSVARGEFVAIVGASGSGKSTLMHIVASVDRPSSGSVRVDGEEITRLDAAHAALYRRRKVGLVYQFFNLIPTVSVRDNIAMPLLLDGKSPDAARLAKIADALGISDRLDAMPSSLSGGQQQRAAIARALIHRPALLLADEPTGNLDQTSAREITALLRASNREVGQTILLITHDDRVAREADRIVTVADGRVVADEGRDAR